MSEVEFPPIKGINKPTPIVYATKYLYDKVKNGRIDLNAEYQRGHVWKEHKEEALVDSIFKNFYVPPVIFMLKTSKEGFERKIVIDGKQRLTSIVRFMDGDIPYKHPDTGVKFYYQLKSGDSTKKKHLMPQQSRDDFDEKGITCVEYTELQKEDELGVFTRVQLGEPLRPNEKLQVFSTPRARFAREIVETNLDDDSPLIQNTNLETSHSKGFGLVVQSMLAIERLREKPGEIPRSTFGERSHKTYLTEEKEVPPSVRTRIRNAYDTFSQLAESDKYNEVFKKAGGKVIKKASRLRYFSDWSFKYTPVEFTMTAVLIAKNYDKMSLQQLAAAIAGMREDLRSEMQEVKTNSRCCNRMLEYIMYVLGNEKASSKSLRERKLAIAANDDESSEAESEEQLTPAPSKTKNALSNNNESVTDAVTKSLTKVEDETDRDWDLFEAVQNDTESERLGKGMRTKQRPAKLT